MYEAATVLPLILNSIACYGIEFRINTGHYAPVRCYKINKLFIAAVEHGNVFSLVFLILMSTCFGLSDLHLAILQKLKLRYTQCNYVVRDPIMLSVVLKYM